MIVKISEGEQNPYPPFHRLVLPHHKPRLTSYIIVRSDV